MWLQFWTSTIAAMQIVPSVYLYCILIIVEIITLGTLRHLVSRQTVKRKTIFSKKYFLEANHIIVCTCGFLRNAFIETTERIQQVSDN